MKSTNVTVADISDEVGHERRVRHGAPESSQRHREGFDHPKVNSAVFSNARKQRLEKLEVSGPPGLGVRFELWTLTCWSGSHGAAKPTFLSLQRRAVAVLECVSHVMIMRLADRLGEEVNGQMNR